MLANTGAAVALPSPNPRLSFSFSSFCALDSSDLFTPPLFHLNHIAQGGDMWPVPPAFIIHLWRLRSVLQGRTPWQIWEPHWERIFKHQTYKPIFLFVEGKNNFARSFGSVSRYWQEDFRFCAKAELDLMSNKCIKNGETCSFQPRI